MRVNVTAKCNRCGESREIVVQSRYAPRRPFGWARVAMDNQPMRLLCDGCVGELVAFFTVEVQEHAHGSAA